MSNLVKQSLEDNLDEILENLPKEFHDDMKSSIEAATPTPKLSDEEAKQHAAELMKENPAILDEECIPLLDSDTTLNKPIALPSEEELKLQMEQSLAEINASLDTESE